MQLGFNLDLLGQYSSKSQIARVLTEDWVLRNAYCPRCGVSPLGKYPANNPAADFFCGACDSDFELKSSRTFPKSKVVDGSYEILIRKVESSSNPNFLFLNYSSDYSARNFLCVPRHFFASNIIEKRKPLGPTAKRCGWIGCNILINHLPASGKVFIVKDGMIVDSSEVIGAWAKTEFLEDQKVSNRGWLLEVMGIIENFPGPEFRLVDLYQYEELLSSRFPGNRFIREKIRQQLQVLRDKEYINFLGHGYYQKA
jgi:type II restriction enzyme